MVMSEFITSIPRILILSLRHNNQLPSAFTTSRTDHHLIAAVIPDQIHKVEHGDCILYGHLHTNIAFKAFHTLNILNKLGLRYKVACLVTASLFTC